MSKNVMVIDTLGFLSITQIVCTIEGLEDNTESYKNYMAVLSFLIAKNALIQRQFVIPVELGKHCKALWEKFETYKESLGEPFKNYNIPFYGIVDLDPNKNPEAA